MTDNDQDGGDIIPGFGNPKVDGPVSDEKAQEMLHAADLTPSEDGEDQEDGDSPAAASGGGGGGGGGW